MSDVDRYVGQAIRRTRRAADLSQSELAERLGVSLPTVARIEHADRPVTIREVEAIGRVLGVDWVVEFLPGGTT